MRKLAAGLLALMLLTGCSNSSKEQTLFVENSKNKYALVNFQGENKTEFNYDKYEAIGMDGYIVEDDGKYGYLLSDGSEVIEIGAYTKLESISNMIVGYDKDEKMTIFDSLGNELYHESSKVKIKLTGLPVIKNDETYLVLYGSGKEIALGSDKIISAYTANDNYTIVNYQDNSLIYYHLSEGEPLNVKLGGDFQLMDQDDKQGYLLYNRETKKASAINLEGKILFTVNQELDDLYYDSQKNIIGVLNQTTYIFNQDGDVHQTNSYYYDYDNYVVKSNDTIYGPHTFYADGKEIAVEDVQLDPLASKVQHTIIPVYVKDKGYQYYGFDGKAVFKTVYESAQIFDRNGLAIVSKKDDLYYLIDLDNKKVSEEYDRIEYLGRKYYAGFVSGSIYEVFDSEGNVVIDDSFMGDGIIFEYNSTIYGIFNKSGTSHVYNMDEMEIIFTCEGELEFNDRGYFVTIEEDKYFTIEGEEIYTR